MGYNELEIELTKTMAQIARWRELGYMPTIEQGIALARLQNMYAELLDLPCGEPESESKSEPEAFSEIPIETSAEAVKCSSGDGCEDITATDDEPIEQTIEEHSSDETYLCQEYGSHDTSSSAPVEVSPPQPQDDDDDKEEIVWADDSTEENADENADENVGENGDDSGEEPSPSKPTITEVVEISPESTPEPTPVKLPTILGIEVNAYTRHEIIDTLFHGNINLFEAETSKMYDMASFDDALVYIGEMYNWIPDNAATIKFIDLLEMRFGE